MLPRHMSIPQRSAERVHSRDARPSLVHRQHLPDMCIRTEGRTDEGVPRGARGAGDNQPVLWQTGCSVSSLPTPWFAASQKSPSQLLTFRNTWTYWSECSLCVIWVFFMCALSDLWLFFVCALLKWYLSFLCVFSECSLCVLCVFVEFLCVCSVCSLSFYVCALCVFWLFFVCALSDLWVFCVCALCVSVLCVFSDCAQITPLGKLVVGKMGPWRFCKLLVQGCQKLFSQVFNA